ncbi:hypothetical protein [Pseudotamlana carrageenivorans]|uniref:Uncharacterized protein n=1 Tax=Pseudotamlana carrageenivorans TaxID=2069432 RepID=A0A2I7SM67_9FLAO|nr:hypothetical protein [Tamlana carrageenivorans]AUS06977.1 hypothetical protein C1A40_16675 [Tamlana carrageenivorans]
MVDLVGFGRNFLTNPDYQTGVKINAKLNTIIDTHPLFGIGTARMDTDYPFLKTKKKPQQKIVEAFFTKH